MTVESNPTAAARIEPLGGSLQSLCEHALCVNHITAALRLSNEAGWNQVAADWELMITAGDSFGLSTANGDLVASGLTVPFATGFGWIAMILVTAHWRRKGLATHLMRRCIDALLARGLAPALDATPDGRQVYLPLGFKDVYGITRYYAKAAPQWDAGPAIAATIRPITLADETAIAAYDTPLFGSNRAYLLQDLITRRPQQAFVTERGSAITGFVLARNGQSSTQIGPLLANDSAIAHALLARALAGVNSPVCIDVLDRHESLRQLLMRFGFTPQFPFHRMIYGRSTPFDDPERIIAIAGPELG
jgi:GNAT superfamily N-acetyltransferase